jgi:hypothetical protein
VRVRIELSERASLSAWLQQWRAMLLQMVADGYSRGGGQVQWYVPAKGRPEPDAFVVGAVRVDLSGWPHRIRTAGSSWLRALADLDAERVSQLAVDAGTADLFGLPNHLRWGRVGVTAQNAPNQLPVLPFLSLEIGDPFTVFLANRAVEDLVVAALRTLPVSRARITFDRTFTHGPWVAILPAALLGDTDREALLRSGLFEHVEKVSGMAGDFIWLQATVSRHALTSARARAVTELFESTGFEDGNHFFTHRFMPY